MSVEPAKVISITSGKGGVGKSHTTINLGLALLRLGKKVLLLDADLGLANINVLLGFEPGVNISEVIAGKAKLADVIVHHSTGVDIIPASSGLSELTNLSEEERMLLVTSMEDVAFDYDYLLVDTAAGIGDNVLYFNIASEEIIVIIDPEPTSITDAYAVVKVLSTKCGVKSFQVLVNRAPVGSDGRAAFAQLANAVGKFLNAKLSFLGSVQEDSSVIEATIAQKPYSELYPSCRASIDIGKIARRLESGRGPRLARGGLQFFFRALVEQ